MQHSHTIYKIYPQSHHAPKEWPGKEKREMKVKDEEARASQLVTQHLSPDVSSSFPGTLAWSSPETSTPALHHSLQLTCFCVKFAGRTLILKP